LTAYKRQVIVIDLYICSFKKLNSALRARLWCLVL